MKPIFILLCTMTIAMSVLFSTFLLMFRFSTPDLPDKTIATVIGIALLISMLGALATSSQKSPGDF